MGEPEDRVTLEVVLKPLQVVSFPSEVELSALRQDEIVFFKRHAEPPRVPRARCSSIHISSD